MRGKFVTFEGVDGSGKSTQVKFAVEWMRDAGIGVLLTREPGGTTIGERIRDILLDSKHVEMCDVTEMLLYAAARAQIVREVVEPALISGTTVLCDRWTDSSIAYQGAARGLGRAVEEVNRCAAGELFSPDATILLDIDPETALERASGFGRKNRDRIETMGLGYQKKVRKAYLEIAAQHPKRVYVIDASGRISEVRELVFSALADIFS